MRIACFPKFSKSREMENFLRLLAMESSIAFAAPEKNLTCVKYNPHSTGKYVASIFSDTASDFAAVSLSFCIIESKKIWPRNQSGLILNYQCCVECSVECIAAIDATLVTVPDVTQTQCSVDSTYGALFARTMFFY